MNLTNSFFLLQAITPTGDDDRSVIIWVAVAAVTALGVVGTALIKILQDHPKQIREINTAHGLEITNLNSELRELQSSYSQQFLEYSQMLHNAVREVANVHPEVKEELNNLEKHITSEFNRMALKLENMTKATGK